MNRSIVCSAVAALVVATACESPTTHTSSEVVLSTNHVNGLSVAMGGGHYVISIPGLPDLPGQFAFNAVQRNADGDAVGHMRFTLDFLGQEIDFKGRVTCVTMDLHEGRAWIGGVVTQNLSKAEPWASGEIYEPGKDLWFRVLDVGEGVPEADRTTFVGFEGAADIITSPEYCEKQIWADGNARTWPVTGNVQVY